MPFVQIIEYETDVPDQLRKLSEQWSQEQPLDGPVRLLMSEDREKPGHFVMVAEFDSFEHAMEHSDRPETASYADRMRKLARSDPRFINLDVTLAKP